MLTNMGKEQPKQFILPGLIRYLRQPRDGKGRFSSFVVPSNPDQSGKFLGEVVPSWTGPYETEKLIKRFLEEGYLFEGVNTPLSEDSLERLNWGEEVRVVSASSGDNVICLPIYAPLIIEGLMSDVYKPISLAVEFQGNIPRKYTHESDDPAAEKTIGLMELIKELERVRNSRDESCIIFSLYMGRGGEPLTSEDIKKALNDPRFTKRVLESFHFYDILAINTPRINPYGSVYPIPAFMEQFDIDGPDTSISSLVKYFIESSYATRVIIVPRVRDRHGMIDSDFDVVAEYLREVIKTDGGVLDISEVSREVLTQAGIIVYEREDLDKLRGEIV